MKYLPHALGVVVLIGLLSYVGATCYNSRVRKWERERDSLLATNRVLDSLQQEERQRRDAEMRIADSLYAISQSQERAAQIAYDNASRYQSEVVQLRTRLASVQTAGDSVPVLLAIVERQDSTISSLHAETWSLRASLASQIEASGHLRAIIDSHVRQHATDSARISSLESLVRRAPTSKPKLLGILPMPSREVAFVAGAVVGFLAHQQIK